MTLHGKTNFYTCSQTHLYSYVANARTKVAIDTGYIRTPYKLMYLKIKIIYSLCFIFLYKILHNIQNNYKMPHWLLAIVRLFNNISMHVYMNIDIIQDMVHDKVWPG